MRAFAVAALLLLTAATAITLAVLFRRAFTEGPAITTRCFDEYGRELTSAAGQPPSKPFTDCVRRGIDLFMKHDYAESKDLAKSFLTLLTALLVVSITFSEKIIDFARATWVPKGLMVACWLSLLGAIVACGTGLAFMAMAAGWAAYQPFRDYRVFEFRGAALFLTAGLAFGVGLATLLTAGIISLVQRPSNKDADGV